MCQAIQNWADRIAGFEQAAGWNLETTCEQRPIFVRTSSPSLKRKRWTRIEQTQNMQQCKIFQDRSSRFLSFGFIRVEWSRESRAALPLLPLAPCRSSSLQTCWPRSAQLGFVIPSHPLFVSFFLCRRDFHDGCGDCLCFPWFFMASPETSISPSSRSENLQKYKQEINSRPAKEWCEAE